MEIENPILPVAEMSVKRAFAYNPSLIDFDGKRLVSYRFHPDLKHWRTQLEIQCDGEALPVSVPDQYEKHSHEDARFFTYLGKLYLSCTISRSRVQGQSVDPCVIIFGEIVKGKKAWTFRNWRQPIVGKNDMTGAEKNWVFWEWDKKLLFSYKTSPHHLVCEMGIGNDISRSWKTESPVCPFGDYRGGTQSFPFQGNLMRFVHVVKNNKEAKLYWLYHLAAIVFESKPPFRVLKVSREPILTGNEAYTPYCAHWKPRIVICYGAVKDGDGWIVSYGNNDSACMEVRLTERDLNL